MNAVGKLLKTCPVGAEVAPAVGPGMVTAGMTFVVIVAPLTESTEARPVPLSEIQNGLVVEEDMPHGLTRLGSVLAAGIRAESEIRLNCMKVGAAVAPSIALRSDVDTVSLMTAPQGFGEPVWPPQGETLPDEQSSIITISLPSAIRLYNIAQHLILIAFSMR